MYVGYVVCAGQENACRVCCNQDGVCRPLVNVTESLADGVPCIGDEGNGACFDVSEISMCM